MKKDDRFILKYIIFQRNEDKRILRFVRLPPLRLCLSSLRAAGPATHTLEHTLSHARNQQTAFIFLFILKKKKKKHTCKRAAAHMGLISVPVA